MKTLENMRKENSMRKYDISKAQDMSGKMKDLVKKEVIKRQEEVENNNSKSKLLNNIGKKIQTTMIGSIDSFERIFGFLWGNGKKVSELTEEERNFRKLWENARTEVLDRGNHQKKAAMKEISQYTVSWNKYKMEFIATDKTGILREKRR